MPANDLQNQSFVQRYVLLIVSIFLLLSLVAYFLNFNGTLSPDHEVWAQFGDFLGGVVNPMVGFCTIWLLTVSLRQNQIALRQANEEMLLARQALEDSRTMQSKTGDALKQQIEIADQTRDLANATALSTYFSMKADGCNKKASKQEQEVRKSGEMLQIRAEHHRLSHLANDLERMLEIEVERLKVKYPNFKQ